MSRKDAAGEDIRTLNPYVEVRILCPQPEGRQMVEEASVDYEENGDGTPLDEWLTGWNKDG